MATIPNTHASTELGFKVSASVEAVRSIAAEVAAFCAANRRLAPLEHRIVLVLEELATNTVSYGYEGGAGVSNGIEIRLSVRDDCLFVVYEDDARPYDPTRNAPHDVDGNVADRAVGGLGIHLVMTIMDGVRYERDGNKNRLEMRMSLPG